MTKVKITTEDNLRIYSTVNLINTIYIPDQRVASIQEEVENSLLFAMAAKMDKSTASAVPNNILLLGDAGAGKTTVCSAITEKYPKHVVIEDGYSQTIIPTFYCSVTETATVKGLASAMLKAVGDANYDKGNAFNMTTRLHTLLSHSGTNLIILDEIQHLINSRDTKSAKKRL